ncbi:hypothetical protein ACLOJK_012287 [Asimina triloba]
MAKKKAESGNSYEEARKQRLEDNLRRIQHHHGKPSQKKSIEVSELRRSSRERNVVTSYREVRHLVSLNFKEGRIASYEERLHALEKAENLQSKLNSGHPSFVKSMLRSHGLPRIFCKDHLPTTELNMILEDENGSEYDAIYLGRKTGLSGGWRAFALDHQLDDGDALVFELTELTRFKVYIIKGCEHLEEDDEEPIIAGEKHTGKSKGDKINEDGDGSASKELRRQTESIKRAERVAKRRTLR